MQLRRELYVVRDTANIEIKKIQEIIPQVISVEASRRPAEATPWPAPERCPACGAMTSRVADEVALRCTNSGCSGRLKALVWYFTRRSAMDIGRLGKVLVEQLVDEGLVTDLADLFSLNTKRPALIGLERMAEKSVDNVLKAIDAARASRPLARLLTGLGIPLVGSTAAQLIAERYGALEDLLAPEPDALVEGLDGIHGIGQKIAESVADYFHDPHHRKVIQKMHDLGVRTTAPEPDPVSKAGPLRGLSFCVTGTMSQPRDAIHGAIQAAGGQVHRSVKKGTSYLVAGEKVGKSKIEKADRFGCKVIDEDALARMISQPEPQQ